MEGNGSGDARIGHGTECNSYVAYLDIVRDLLVTEANGMNRNPAIAQGIDGFEVEVSRAIGGIF